LKGFKQPKTIEERLTIAKEFVGDFDYGVPMVADSMENKFDSIFACWPVRYYILHNGHVYYKAQPNEAEYTYSVEDLREALARCTGRADLAIEKDDDISDSSDCKTNGSCTTQACSVSISSTSVSCPSGACPI